MRADTLGVKANQELEQQLAYEAKGRHAVQPGAVWCNRIEALPDEVRHFMFIDGVWVCSWPCVAALATALRQGLIEIGRSQLSAQGQQEKMAVLYGYLSSSEFRHRIEAIVDSLVAMEQDLASEKRSQLARWTKRGKQIQRSIESSASLYGDLQGILGATLPDLESLTLGVDCEDRLLTLAE